jgi:hypothetical protein
MRVLVGLFVAALFVYCASAQTTVPAEWTCDPSTYAEKSHGHSTFSCDCGCGVYDPDCMEPAVSGSAADRIQDIYCLASRQDKRDRSKTSCGADAKCVSVPHEWICEPRWYSEGVHGASGSFGTLAPVCHCGCGIWDPDCAHRTNNQDAPLFCESASRQPVQSNAPKFNSGGGGWQCSRKSATCTNIPKGWFCDASMYDEISNGAPNPSCHCGCGTAYDPDCAENPNNQDLPLYCQPLVDNQLDNTGSTCSAKTGTCTGVPGGWTCPRRWWNEHTTLSSGSDGTYDCDCGCGIYDPDCDVSAGYTPEGNPNNPNKLVVAVPIWCDPLDAHPSVGVACAAKTLTCTPVPVGWTCPPRWYDEATTGSIGPDVSVDCDCGCGEYDPDCASKNNAPLFCAAGNPTVIQDSGRFDAKCKKFEVELPSGETRTQGLCVSN